MAKAVSITFKGRVYGSLNDASKAIGCSPAYIRKVLQRANGDQEIIEEELSNFKAGKHAVEVDGYHFSSLSEAERQTGIPSRLLKRIKMESKCDKEFSQKVKEEAEGFYALGQWYWSIRQASSDLGIEEEEMSRVFKRYNYSQKEMDRQLQKLRGE